MVLSPRYNARVMSESSVFHLSDESTVAIVGVGLIGGSIAAALKERRFAGTILGVGRSSERLSAAQKTGLIDQGETDLQKAASESDVIVFCTPVDRIVEGVLDAASACRPGTLITDAGSVKGSICDALADRMPSRVTFIGSHPLAGSEKRGFEHAEADLFEQRVCVVTPTEGTPPEQLARVNGFWQSLGCRVVQMSTAAHDRALARTSHLPHVVAAALASQLEGDDVELASTGFRDTTRIASGDADLWTAIMLANADQILHGIDGFEQTLAEFREGVANRDAAALKKLLQLAKRKRETPGA